MDVTSRTPGGLRSLCATTLALFVVVFAGAATQRAAASSFSASPLPGSTFTAADGDQDSASGSTDWQSYANQVTSTVDSPVPATTGPDFFYAGQEDSPDTWTLSSTDGGIAPAKSNALAAFSLKDPLLGDQFLYFAFQRESPSNANAFLGFELNKVTTTWTNSAGTVIPCRSNGDLLISYEIDPSSKSVIFTAYRWNANSVGPAACPEGKTGTFTPVALPLGASQGYINFDNAITNYLATSTSIPAGPLPTSFAAGTFGEGAVNISNTIGAGADPCFSFGQVQLHTRSSASLSSALQDTVTPAPIILRQCTASGTKFEDRNANGVKDAGEAGLAGWRMYVDSDNDNTYDAGEPFAITADGTAPGAPLGSYTISGIGSGAKTIREAPPAGDTSTWYCGGAPGPAGTLSSGGADSCHYTRTFTASSNFTGLDFGNYREPTIEVVKNLVPSTDAGRFDLKIDGATEKADAGDADTTTPHAVALGVGHTISETGGSTPATDLADYTTTYSCTKNGQASLTGSGTTIAVAAGELTAGDALKCTFTNTRDTTLTVIKQVDNGDGGTKAPSDWTMNVSAANPSSASFAGSSAGTTVTIDPGAFSVSETAGAGVVAGSYTLASQVGCSGTALVGQHYTCTLVNDDVAPKLTVVKTVVNKNGSTATASDFTMHINGSAGTQSFAGAASPGTTKTLVAGTYAVTETGASTADYSASASADCAGTLAVGDEKTCTITNTRKTGTITVVKDLIPATDTGRFNLRIDGNVVRTDAGDGDGSGAVSVNTGTHTVSEVAGSIGDVNDYASSISCTPGGASAMGRGPLDVTVTDGADITCTVTNTRRAIITVRKVTTPEPSATQFAFASDLPATAGPPAIAADGTFSLAHGTSVSTTVLPGTYHVSENDPKQLGYKLTGLVCTESKSQNSTAATGAAIATSRNATLVADAGETIECTYTNRRVIGQAVVVKVGDTFAYHGDTASYTFTVTNGGNSPLHDVHVTDDKCPNVSAQPTSKQNDNGDALLDPVGADGTNPEVWVFTCSYTIGSHQGGETNPIVNTATVTGIDEYDRPVSDTDQHSTALLHPAVSLAKTGPATATAGDLVTYALTVTNTGDVAFPAALVILKDALCDAPPLLVGLNGDSSPTTLDPGDRWLYRCTVQTAAGQSNVHNVASVDATDVNGRPATAGATADTALTQRVVIAPPPPAAAPVQRIAGAIAASPARARLRGTTGCMPGRSTVFITGTRIAKVKFTLDGKRSTWVSKADSKGRYVYTVRRTGLRTGMHKVVARVTFVTNSAPTSRTLTMTLNRCPRAVAKPAFTG